MLIPVDKVAALIDHTLLKPEATRADIARLCTEGRTHRFASVCVNPAYVSEARQALAGSGVNVCSVVAFPLGAQPPETKAAESRRALDDGAGEIDMVMNIGALKGREATLVLDDIRAVVLVCREHGAVLKVIIETALLTDEEKLLACQLSVQAGADYVKTSTGFAATGATVEDVTLMRRAVAPAGLGVKAAGGIRSFTDLVRMVDAGATRIGSSASVKILEEAAAASK